MGLKSRVVLAMVVFGGLGSCSSFPYRHYGLDAQSYEGTLLGPEPKDDLPLSVCKPDDQVQGKCIVVLAAEWFRLKQEYLDMQSRLKACEEQ